MTQDHRDQMDKAIKEYSEAFREHAEATNAEVQAKLRVQKSHYALLQAKSLLRELENDLIGEIRIGQ